VRAGVAGGGGLFAQSGPNIAVEPTPNSFRSCVAPAIGRGSPPAIGWGTFSRGRWRGRLTVAEEREAQEPAIRARRAGVFPACVMPPCRRRSPDEDADGVKPSAVPIEVFWHTVYSAVCKHPSLYACSRRTSGQQWRAVSRRCRHNRHAHTPLPRSSILAPASPSGRCCTRVPRTFGQPTSRWTLALAAEVSFAQRLTPRLVSDETVRLALRRLRVSWKRAKHWITSPAPAYARKKNGTTS
jgi:hypothetical protein